MSALKSRWKGLALSVAVMAVAAVVTYASVSLLDDDDGQIAQPASAGQLQWTIEDARAFDGFTLYWLGESYEGLPLTKITRYRYDPPPELTGLAVAEYSVAFLYGDCTPSSDGGCPYPVQIILEPYCMRPPELLAPEVKDGPPTNLRGATAQSAGPFDLFLWTGDVRVGVFGSIGPNVAAQQIAQDLRAVAPGGPEGGGPLPPPDPGAC